MSILFRTLWVIIAGFLRPKMGFDEVSRLKQIVWPIDLDINIHMNNARYLAVMDLGRIDWIIRTGTWRLMRYEKMAPIVGGCMVRYRRSLAPFDRFTLTTRMLGFDARWIYVEQVMRSEAGIACIAVQRTALTQAGRVVPPAELARKLNYHGPIMPPPDWVAGWNDTEAAFARAAEENDNFNSSSADA